MREIKLQSIIVAVFLATASAAEHEPIRVTGVFSNLAYNEEGGDLLGWELLVVPKDDNTYTAVVQIAEGGSPWVGIAVLSVRGLNVSLVVPKSSPYAGTYSGKLGPKELILTMSDGVLQRLVRGKSYWQ